MATGLPCLVTPYLGISEGIGQAGQHYQLVERNHEAIALALANLLQNQERRTTFGDKGRRYVAANGDQRRSLDHYTELYEDLAVHAMRRR